MTEVQLFQQKGKPHNKLSVGAKSIYQWPDLSVTVVDGKVEGFKTASPPSPSAVPRKSSIKQVPTKNGNVAPKSDGAVGLFPVQTADTEERRLQLEIAKKYRIVGLESEIKSIEAQLSAESKRMSIGKTQTGMSAEQEQLLRLQLEKTQRELAKLR